MTRYSKTILLLLTTVFYLSGCGSSVVHDSGSHLLENPSTYSFQADIRADFMPEPLAESGDVSHRFRLIILTLSNTATQQILNSSLVSPVSCDIYVNGVLKESVDHFDFSEGSFIASGDLSFLNGIHSGVKDGQGNRIPDDEVTVSFTCLIDGVKSSFSATPTLNIVY